MMKTVTAALALTLIFSGAALAETAKPAKTTKPVLDNLTTQSIAVPSSEPCFTLSNSQEGKCAKANLYPDNALSGMNLGY